MLTLFCTLMAIGHRHWVWRCIALTSLSTPRWFRRQTLLPFYYSDLICFLGRTSICGLVLDPYPSRFPESSILYCYSAYQFTHFSFLCIYFAIFLMVAPTTLIRFSILSNFLSVSLNCAASDSVSLAETSILFISEYSAGVHIFLVG